MPRRAVTCDETTSRRVQIRRYTPGRTLINSGDQPLSPRNILDTALWTAQRRCRSSSGFRKLSRVSRRNSAPLTQHSSSMDAGISLRTVLRLSRVRLGTVKGVIGSSGEFVWGVDTSTTIKGPLSRNGPLMQEKRLSDERNSCNHLEKELLQDELLHATT